MRKGALLKARALLMVDPLTTQLGASLLSSAGTLVDESVIVQSFSDAFSPKATSTLVKRMSALWRYGKWCMTTHTSPFNMKEEQLYAYLTQLRDSQAAPSAAESFIEAIHFLHSIVFIKCFANGVSVSGRCKGLAKSELRRKRKRRQAPPLTVAMVRAMENFLIDNYSDHRGVICGHLLFCIYSCARWSDTLRLVEIEKYERGTITLLETATEHHKSALTDDAKSLFLPLLCLGQCLEPHPWGTYWLNARIVSKIGRPWMDTAQPGWDDRKGRFRSNYMSSTEATMRRPSGFARSWRYQDLEETQLPCSPHTRVRVYSYHGRRRAACSVLTRGADWGTTWIPRTSPCWFTAEIRLQTWRWLPSRCLTKSMLASSTLTSQEWSGSQR